MNTEEKNTGMTEANAVLNIPDRSAPKTETKTVSKSERLSEKLKLLCEKREKAFTAQSAAEKKTKEIDEQINKIRTELHNDEIRVLDNFCKSRNLTIGNILDFLTALTEKMTLTEAAALLDITFEDGGNKRE